MCKVALRRPHDAPAIAFLILHLPGIFWGFNIILHRKCIIFLRDADSALLEWQEMQSIPTHSTKCRIFLKTAELPNLQNLDQTAEFTAEFPQIMQN